MPLFCMSSQQVLYFKNKLIFLKVILQIEIFKNKLLNIFAHLKSQKNLFIIKISQSK